MSRELRTYTLNVVVEPDDDMWHAYCPTLLALAITHIFSCRINTLQAVFKEVPFHLE
jgi:hypothetical protein